MFLFVQQWEIIRGKGAEYTDFVLRRHLPVMTKVGLNTIGGFHVIVGSGPRISSSIASAICSVRPSRLILFLASSAVHNCMVFNLDPLCCVRPRA